MKITRLCYFEWQGQSCVATLKQDKTLPESKVNYYIQAVDYSETGDEFRGCIISQTIGNSFENLGNPTGSLSCREIDLHHIWTPMTTRKTAKLIKREQWKKCVKKILDSVYHDSMKQAVLF